MNKIELLKNSLNCAVCKATLNNPIILPCSNTICQQHVSESSIETTKYSCCICNQNHDIPNDGFIVNSLAKNIIDSVVFAADEDKLTKYDILESKIELYSLMNRYENEIFEFGRFRSDKCSKFYERVEQTRVYLRSKIDNLMDSILSNFKLCETKLIQKISHINIKYANFKLDIDKTLNSDEENDIFSELDYFKASIENKLNGITAIKEEYMQILSHSSLDKMESVFSRKSKNKNPFENKILITCVGKNKLNVWNMDANDCSKGLIYSKNRIKTIHSLSRNRLLTISFANTFNLWDLNAYTYKEIMHSRTGLNCSLELAQDIILIGNQANLEIWDFKKETFDVIRAHDSDITCLAKLEDNYFITGSMDGRIKLWDFEQGRAVRVLNQYGPVYDIFVKSRFD